MDEMCRLCSSALYTAKQVVINLSSTCGPAISIVLFLCLGNSWEVRPCRFGGASSVDDILLLQLCRCLSLDGREPQPTAVSVL